MSIRVLHFGLGPIGAAVVRQVATRPGFTVVAGIDIDPAKVGRDLGDVVGLDRRLRVKVSRDARAAIKATKPDVVVLCTSSSLKKVWPQIEGAPRAARCRSSRRPRSSPIRSSRSDGSRRASTPPRGRQRSPCSGRA